MIDVEGATMVRKSSTSSIASIENNGNSNEGSMYFEVPVVKSSEDPELDVFDGEETDNGDSSIIKTVENRKGMKPRQDNDASATEVGDPGDAAAEPQDGDANINDKSGGSPLESEPKGASAADVDVASLTEAIRNVALNNLPSIPGYAPAFILSPDEYLVHIPNELVSRLVGPSGAVFEELQNKSGATMVLHEDNQDGLNYRSVTITGSPSQVDYCYKLVEVTVAPTKGPMAPASVSMDIPLEQVGLIIGRYGTTINQLQSASHARIDLPRDGETATSKRIIIHGNPNEVAFCQKLILNKLAEGREKAARYTVRREYQTPYLDPNSYRVTIPEIHIGRVIGKKGAHIRQLQEDSGAKLILPKENNPGTTQRDVIIIGTESQVAHCHRLLMDVITPPGHKTAQIPMYKCADDPPATFVPPVIPIRNPAPLDPGMYPMMPQNFMWPPSVYPGHMMMPMMSPFQQPPPMYGVFPQQQQPMPPYPDYVGPYEYRVSQQAVDTMLTNKPFLEQEFGVTIHLADNPTGDPYPLIIISGAGANAHACFERIIS